MNRSRTPDQGEPLRIVLFSSEKEYKPYQISGPQKARQLAIEYEPVFNTELGTQGNVISIRFK